MEVKPCASEITGEESGTVLDETAELTEGVSLWALTTRPTKETSSSIDRSATLDTVGGEGPSSDELLGVGGGGARPRPRR